MNAKTLNCLSCGAAVASDSPKCEHCGARLATIACPSCFGMMFLGSKFCPDCGSPAAEWRGDDASRLCPGCRIPMLAGELGKVRLHECARCFGIWLDTATFTQLCRNAEQQSAVLGTAEALDVASKSLGPVRYVPCPECSDLMHRVNFARCSGVVVDVCRQHGTWFDRDELQRIILFIRGGGLELSRGREKAQLEMERTRLESVRRDSREPSARVGGDSVPVNLLGAAVVAAAGLLRWWLRK